MRYITILFFSIHLSCNTAVFVKKSRVVHRAEGYFLFYSPESCLFIPSKDSSVSNLMNDTLIKKGFLLYPPSAASSLQLIAQKFHVNQSFRTKEINPYVFLPDSIYVIHSSFNYLIHQQEKLRYTDTIYFDYLGKKLKFSISFNFKGEIQRVYGNSVF